MKFTKYFMPLAAVALLASCSNDTIDQPGVDQPGQTPVEGDGLYMTVNISLPSVEGTRGSLKGYDEGTDDEYAVNNIKLLVFEYDSTSDGTPEEKATFVKDIDVNFGGWDESEKDDVTTVTEATFQVGPDIFVLNDDLTSKNENIEYYGLLIVNYSASELALPAAPQGDSKGGTFAAWQKTIMDQETSSLAAATTMMPALSGETRFFTMTNAPYVTNTNELVVLEKITTKNFAKSPKLATKAAASFYVQRGVAKVGLSFNEVDNRADYTVPAEHTYTGTSKNPDYDDDDLFEAFVTVSNWDLDVLNQGTFPVQVVADSSIEDNGSWEDWMTLGTYFNNKPTGYTTAIKHIWWGIDPNYTGNEKEPSVLFATLGSNGTLTLTPDQKQYCLENTMQYDQMIKNQTTRVVLEGTYYIAEKDEDGNYLYLEKDEETNAYSIKEDYVGMIVFNDIPVYLKSDDILGSTTSEANNGGKSYEYKLKNLVKAGEEDATIEGYRVALKAANTDQVVTYYPGAKTHYVAYVRHFDDSETKADDLDFYNMVIDDYTEDHLGRYGVLRNNMYDVNIVAVSGFGKPDIPEPGDTPDDKIEDQKYNAIVNINILNWAKRSQDYIPR